MGHGSPSNQPAISCHLAANFVAARAIACHNAAMRLVGDLKTYKNQCIKVADSEKRAQARLSHRNKGFALVCSLLRYVWKEYEGRRSEWGVDRPFAQANAGQKPACVTGLRPSDSVSMAHHPKLLAALCGTLMAPTALLADGWKNLGTFDGNDTEPVTERVTRTSTPQPGGWVSFGVSEDWKALDKFERGTPGKRPPNLAAFRLPKGTRVDQLYALIEFAESPQAGYNAIHGSATRLTRKRPTQMTLGEIKSWIKATPGQHHAIGRFQIIPSTLANLQRRLGLADTVVFSQGTQDRMAAVLLADAGYHDFVSQEITVGKFMDNLAYIWAGFPLATGKSAYHGYAGNKATITRPFFGKQMAAIFAHRSAPAADETDQAGQTKVAARSSKNGWQDLTRLGESR